MRLALCLAAAMATPLSAAAETFVVHASNVPDEKAIVATVEPVHELTARARIGGTVASLSIKEGDRVAAGAEIAVIADEKLVLQRQALDSRIEFAAIAARQGEGGLRSVARVAEARRLDAGAGRRCEDGAGRRRAHA